MPSGVAQANDFTATVDTDFGAVDYAFFFEGYTGLAVTTGAVLTLFVLMQVTARVDWGALKLGGAAPHPPDPPLRSPK